MKPFLTLKSVDEVTEMLFGMPMLESEFVKLKDAPGRFLAHPFYAPANLPGFARSTMDGFAVQARDVFGASEAFPALLQKVGACPAGKSTDIKLKAGECAAIVTGAPLPEGADAVAMVEYSRELDNGQVEIIRSIAPGENMVAEDEDAASGQLLLPAYRCVRPQEIGIFAAFGIREIEVVRRARTAIISTGDEIAPIESEPGPGRLRDVNAHSIAAICRAAGSETRELGIARDDPAMLSRMLRKALEVADVIVLSGGSSAGMRDYTIEAFLDLPDSEILVHGVAISPGKPFILAKSGRKCLLGLPGHVSSALIASRVFLAPLLRHLQGLRKPEPEAWQDASMGRSVAGAQGRRDYIRCRLDRTGDGFVAWPLLAPSAVLRGLLDADGLVICPENEEGLAKGEKVRFYPF